MDEDSTDDMIKEIKRLYDERDAAKFKWYNMQSIKKKLEELGVIFSESYTKGSSFLLSDGTYLNLTDQCSEEVVDNNNPCFLSAK